MNFAILITIKLMHFDLRLITIIYIYIAFLFADQNLERRVTNIVTFIIIIYHVQSSKNLNKIKNIHTIVMQTIENKIPTLQISLIF